MKDLRNIARTVSFIPGLQIAHFSRAVDEQMALLADCVLDHHEKQRLEGDNALRSLELLG